MKRTFSMLFVLALLVSAACCAVAEQETILMEEPGLEVESNIGKGQDAGEEQEGQTFKTDYYFLSIPADWEISTDDLETEETYKELGILYAPGDPGMIVETSLAYSEKLKDVILWDSTDEQIQEYVDTLLSDYADDNPEYLGRIQVGNIPFILIKAQDEVGPYHYAETITNGYKLMFFAYSEEDSAALTEEQYGQFLNMLGSFSPRM